MKNGLKMLLAASVLAIAAVSPAQAITNQAWEFQSLGSNGTNNQWNFGTRFEAVNYTFNYLGYYDDFGNGFSNNQTHAVALYDSVGNLLSSAVVSNADPLVGNWRWARVPTMTLTGVFQIHGASGTDNYAWNTVGFGTNPAITYLGNTWRVGNSPDYLDFAINDTRDGYWGANLAYVPEPGSWAMLIAGFGLTGFAMRRRRVETRVSA